MPGAVLLDFDGTLTNSKPGILASYTAAIQALGHRPDPSVDLTYLVGPPVGDVMGEVLAHYGDRRVEQAVELYREHYRTIGRLDSTLYDGVRELLQSLADAGVSMFLATAKRTDISRQMLDRFGLTHLFAGIYGSEPGGALDHKPELIAHILAKHHLTPDSTVMVGDRRYDITGAHANGLRAICVLWGYGSRAELEQAGADDLVATPAQLATALLGR